MAVAAGGWHVPYRDATFRKIDHAGHLRPQGENVLRMRPNAEAAVLETCDGARRPNGPVANQGLGERSCILPIAITVIEILVDCDRQTFRLAEMLQRRQRDFVLTAKIPFHETLNTVHG